MYENFTLLNHGAIAILFEIGYPRKRAKPRKNIWNNGYASWTSQRFSMCDKQFGQSSKLSSPIVREKKKENRITGDRRKRWEFFARIRYFLLENFFAELIIRFPAGKSRSKLHGKWLYQRNNGNVVTKGSKQRESLFNFHFSIFSWRLIAIFPLHSWCVQDRHHRSKKSKSVSNQVNRTWFVDWLETVKKKKENHRVSPGGGEN